MQYNLPRRLEGVGLSMIRQIMLKAQGCVNLGLGEPEMMAPKGVRRSARQVIAEGPILYSPNAGLPQLCEAIRQYHGARRGYSVCVTNGSQEALFDVLFALVDPGEEVLLPDPGFPAYATVALLAGGLPVAYALSASENFSFDRKAFDQGLHRKPKAAIINFPSNPTGKSINRADLEWAVARCAQEGVWLISDEIYRDVHYLPERPPTATDCEGPVLVLSGVSKMAAMSGWRIGWAYGPQEVIEKVTVMHQYTSSCASTLAQKAALELFGPEGKLGMERRRKRLLSNRDLMCDFLSRSIRRPFISPEGSLFVLLSVADLSKSSLSVALELIEHGVAVVPGAAFGDQAEGYLRLSFAGRPEIIEEGLKRLEKPLSR